MAVVVVEVSVKVRVVEVLSATNVYALGDHQVPAPWLEMEAVWDSKVPLPWTVTWHCIDAVPPEAVTPISNCNR
jgi:hypothetical protein